MITNNLSASHRLQSRYHHAAQAACSHFERSQSNGASSCRRGHFAQCGHRRLVVAVHAGPESGPVRLPRRAGRAGQGDRHQEEGQAITTHQLLPTPFERIANL